MSDTSEITIKTATPILRIFDGKLAQEFYMDYLGFTVDWEHRFEENMPLYMQVSNGGCVIHLSEHHGDCSPGAAIRIEVDDIKGLHAQLESKQYSNARPGLESTPWGMIELTVIDPFHNRIVFFENPS
jgi:uncharacterized glyoxalase superfamily protein PhnB